MYVKIASGRISTVYNNGAASANSSYNGGFAYDTTGKLQVDTAAVPATKSFSNGIARHSDGVLCVNTHDPSIIPYAYLPGVATNYFSTPNAAANQITGDIDIRIKVAINDWTPVSAFALISKYATTNGRAYEVDLNTNGTLVIQWTPDTDAHIIAATSTVATGIADGTVKWLRIALDVDNGAAGNTIVFYLSDDGVTWTQLGNAVTNAGVTSIAASTDALFVGTRPGAATALAGNIYRAQIYNVIGGTTPVVDFNAADWSETSTNGATQASSTTGETWTLNNTGATPAIIVGIARGHGGLFTDNSGALYVSVGDAVTTAIAGIPVTAKGAIAVSAVT